ncbi:MAG TPA: CopG family transcriptional regulator [Acetobacteraceae bacterium]|nr:CopG family transcriptional regulator [Acetobacteraceae bacterium]
MRTLIDIPEPELQALSELAQRQGVSRAAVIREAVNTYLASRTQHRTADAFGLWGKAGPDGLDLQRQLRDEW